MQYLGFLSVPGETVGMVHLLGKTSKEFIPLSSNASFAIGMNVAWGGVSQDKLEKESKKKAIAAL